MFDRHRIGVGLIAVMLLCLSAVSTHAEDMAAPAVQVVATDDGRWQLLRHSEPYFIKGAGGHEHLDVLAEAGGNSIRTWGADNAGPLLDKAAEHGLTVTVGIWLGHERHGFDYRNEQAVREQLERARDFVHAYKDHPALLMWGVGNEMEGRGDNPLIWQAVNDIAQMIKQEDPNHPTMTVISEIGDPKLDNFNRYCPAVDVLGINSYGGLASLKDRLSEAGYDGPYVVTEFGPLGQWEVGKAAWGAPLEMTSTEKAEFYERGYRQSIAGNPGRCLGSYVFNWGTKQEVTGTWYSMFVDRQYPTATVDVISRQWTGQWPKNRAPRIKPIECEVALGEAAAGGEYVARVDASDPDGDKLEYRWVVQSESGDRKTGGDAESTPPVHDDAVLSAEGNGVRFRAPETAGAYRLFVYVHDDRGKVATANMPFRVGG